MCGIAGILNLKERYRQDIAIQQMTDRLAHRGPDAEGLYADEWIALGHRRLAIIDLNESANQPMWDTSGRYGIVFNGEIYNYRELKVQLSSFEFQTDSDTEVLLAAYMTWGTECLHRLNGMFAFAIWDKVEQRLFLGRDRIGKKLLYYYQDESFFLFASEVRSLLSSGKIPRQLEHRHLPEYLQYQAAIGEHTLVRGVKRVQAGHYAVVTRDSFSETPYWKPGHILPSKDDPHTAKMKIRDLLMDAVQKRMISDVPLGAFLSGGIDSGLVVACMAEQSATPVNTFTISFNEKQFDESDFANLIATKYKTHHHRIILTPAHFLDSVEDILNAMDTPSGDGPNTYVVSKHTREAGIKVALSGLGGDELFVGYNKFMMYQGLMRHQWLLRFPGRLRHALAKRILAGDPGHKMEKLARLMDLPKWNLSTIYPVLRGGTRFTEINKMISSESLEDDVTHRLASMQSSIESLGHFSNCTVGEFETYTRDVLLRDTDQMSMAHALEVRVPFLDYRLVEYILSLPDAIKYPHTPKQLLVEAMAPRLPKAISHRKKMGFTLPWHQWLKNDLASLTDQRIRSLADRPEFNADEMLAIWKRFQQGDPKILWSRIWKLVVLSDWLDRNNL